MPSDAALLSAIAKRSSQQELDRLQTIGTLLLAQLKSNAANIIGATSQESQQNSQQQQQQQEDASNTSIRKCLQWSSVSPRFIYIAASNKIIRSADRGRSWKAVPMPSIFSSGSNNITTNSASTSVTSPTAPNSLPKIIRIASCSTTGAIAFSGTQRSVGISLKVGGPFQMLTQGLNQMLSSPAMNIVHTNPISLNTLFFDSCGLLLFVGSTVTAPNFLCVYSILSTTWFPVFSAAAGLSSSSAILSVSCFKLLRESISEGTVEVAIFYSPSSSSSSSSSTNSNIIGGASHQPASVIKNRNSKILQKVAHDSAATKSKTQQQQQKQNATNNANPPPPTTTMLVDGVGGFQLYQISRSPAQSSYAVLRKSPIIPHKLGSILTCHEIDPFFSNSTNNNSNVECLPPSFVLRRFRWISRWRPGAANVAPLMNSSKLPAGTKTTQMRTPASSKKRYDYTLGSIVPSSQLPFVTEFFSSASSPSSTTATTQQQQHTSPMTLLDNLAEDDPFLVMKTPIAELVKKIQSKKKPAVKSQEASSSSSSSSSSSDTDDDAKDQEKFEIEDTFRGGFFPQTAPRLLACYSTGGRVVDSDATCFLWFWLGEPTDVEETNNDDPNAENNNNNSNPIDQDAGAIYTTVTNISYLPLVQSSTTTTTTTTSAGTGGSNVISSSSFSLNTQGSLLSVLDHGRSWLRCGISGAATSYDGGKAWSDPQMSCIAACCTLDRQSHLVVASRPGFALLPELEQSVGNNNMASTNKPSSVSTSSGSMSALLPPRGSTTSNNAAAVNGVNMKKWNLFTIPTSLGCSVMSDVCVLE